jgi:hypothetical protein
MHGLMGGGWKRGATTVDAKDPGGETPGVSAKTYCRATPPRQSSTLLRLADTPRVFRNLDEWFRRRMRQIRWKEWKRSKARHDNLVRRGINSSQAWEWASSGKGYWRIAASPVLTRSLPNSYWDKLGLRQLFPTWERFRSA